MVYEMLNLNVKEIIRLKIYCARFSPKSKIHKLLQPADSYIVRNYILFNNLNSLVFDYQFFNNTPNLRFCTLGGK